MKIRPMGEKFHADGQTDMKKLTVAFLSFANAPTNMTLKSYRQHHLQHQALSLQVHPVLIK